MGLFGKPNISKMKEKLDYEGLLKVIFYKKNNQLSFQATIALVEIAATIGQCRFDTSPFFSALKMSSSEEKKFIAEIINMVYASTPYESKGKLLLKIESVSDQEALLCFLSSPYPDIRISAIEGLVQTRDSHVIRQLTPLMDEKDEKIRQQAVIALQKLNWKPENTKDAIRFFILLRDWEKLAKLGIDALEPVVKYIRKVENNEWKEPTEAVLCKIVNSNNFEKILKYAGDKNKNIKKAIIYTLGEIHDERAFSTLETLATDDDPNIRCLLTEALRKIGGSKSIELLGKMLENNPDDALSIIEELINTDSNEAVNHIMPFINNKDTRIKELSIWGVMKLHGPNTDMSKITSVLRNDAFNYSRTTLQNIWPQQPDKAACAIEYLTELNFKDSALKSMLEKNILQVRNECESENTSHGGFTLSQVYWVWVRAAENYLKIFK